MDKETKTLNSEQPKSVKGSHPLRGRLSFTLLEFQIAMLLLAFLMLAVSRLISVEALQVRWIEEQGYYSGTHAPTKNIISTVVEQALLIQPTLTGRYEVLVGDMKEGPPNKYKVSLQRISTTTAACGYASAED